MDMVCNSLHHKMFVDIKHYKGNWFHKMGL